MACPACHQAQIEHLPFIQNRKRCQRANLFPGCRRIYFETDLFKGCVVIWAVGLPSTPPGLFRGQKRKTSITIQGQFRRPLPLDDVVTGQEFLRRPKNLPAMWLVETVLIRVRASYVKRQPLFQKGQQVFIIVSLICCTQKPGVSSR